MPPEDSGHAGDLEVRPAHGSDWIVTADEPRHRAVAANQTRAAASTQPASCAASPTARPPAVNAKARWLRAIDIQDGRLGSIKKYGVDLFQELSRVERLAKHWNGAVQDMEMIDRIDVDGNHKRSLYQAPLFQGQDEFRTAHARHLDVGD